MRRIRFIIMLICLCFFALGCGKEKNEDITIYGVVTAWGLPVSDCNISAGRSFSETYMRAITGLDGTYEMTFVPAEMLTIDADADVMLIVSLYGKTIKTEWLHNISRGTKLHYDIDVSDKVRWVKNCRQEKE